MYELAPSIDSQHASLLVMDCQTAVLQSLGETEGLLTEVANAVALARRSGMHVCYVRVAFDDEDYAAVPPHSGMAPIIAAVGRALHAESPATAIHRSAGVECGDVIVRKTRIGAFSTTDLGDQLQARGITTLVLAGVSTSGVVLSTVRDAHDRDYRVFVLADATADPEPEVHEFLLQRIFPRQAGVINVADFDRILSAGMRGAAE